MQNGDRNTRRDLHEHLFELHQALDRLEADDSLHEMDYLLAAAAALFDAGVARFEQLHHCLAVYARPTPPPPIPLTTGHRAHSQIRSLERVKR
jgi:hypothetical protein